MPISTLHFRGLGPFDEVDFEFDPHINLFVGPNNCGKSTVLFALADLSVSPFNVPRKLLHERTAAFLAKFSHKGRRKVLEGTFPIWRSGETDDWPVEKFKSFELERRRLGRRQAPGPAPRRQPSHPLPGTRLPPGRSGARLLRCVPPGEGGVPAG